MIEPIREELAAVLREASSFVRSRLHDVQVRMRQRFVSMGFPMESVVQRDYSAFCQRERNTFLALPKFKELVDNFSVHSEVAKAFRLPAERRQMEDDFFQHYLLPLIVSEMQNEEMGKGIEETIEASLASLDEFLMKDSYEVVHSAALFNLMSSLDEAQIGGSTRIRRISQSEREEWFGIVKSAGAVIDVVSVAGAAGLMITFQLEMSASYPRETAHLDSHASEIGKLLDIVACMRVVKRGAVRIVATKNEISAFWGRKMGQESFHPVNVIGKPYAFGEDELKAVKAAISQKEKLKSDPQFSLAIGRFLNAYDKPEPRERIVDYWIGLESLLLPDGGQGELKYRAALRLAYLVGDPGTRESMFKDAQRSYDFRSKIVHGKPHQVNNDDAEETEEMLRRTLRHCLELGHVPQKKEWDALVLASNDTVN